MFDVSFTELLVIGVVALIVIGPERLPKVAKTVGHLLGRAQRYVSDVKGDIRREIELDELRQFKSEMDEASQSVQSTLRDTESSLRAPAEELRNALDKTARDARAGLSGKDTSALSDKDASTLSGKDTSALNGKDAARVSAQDAPKEPAAEAALSDVPTKAEAAQPSVDPVDQAPAAQPEPVRKTPAPAVSPTAAFPPAETARSAQAETPVPAATEKASDPTDDEPALPTGTRS